MSTHQKEKNLIEKIEKAKIALARFQEKRKGELGTLAVKAGLAHFENEKLFSLFQKIASGEIGGAL